MRIQQMHVKLVAWLLALIFASVSANFLSGQTKNTAGKVYFDKDLFIGLYWEQPIDEVTRQLGKPFNTGNSKDATILYYRGPALGGMPTAIALGFEPKRKVLRSAQYMFLNELDDNPNQYMQAYGLVEDVLKDFYGKSTRFDWFSSKKQPSFTGEELVKQQLTMIALWEKTDKIISHTMIYSEGHMNHAITLHDPRAQDLAKTLQIYQEQSNEILAAAVRKVR